MLAVLTLLNSRGRYSLQIAQSSWSCSMRITEMYRDSLGRIGEMISSHRENCLE